MDAPWLNASSAMKPVTVSFVSFQAAVAIGALTMGKRSALVGVAGQRCGLPGGGPDRRRRRYAEHPSGRLAVDVTSTPRNTGHRQACSVTSPRLRRRLNRPGAPAAYLPCPLEPRPGLVKALEQLDMPTRHDDDQAMKERDVHMHGHVSSVQRRPLLDNQPAAVTQ